MKTGSRTVDQVNPKTDERMTPQWLFDMMGLTFDLDVCAPAEDVSVVPASKAYTLADDGMALPWFGRVWMNPPYSETTAWVDRFIAHGHGVALVPHSRSKWHSRLWASSAALADPNQMDRAMFEFVVNGKFQHVYMPVVLAAFGDECVEAIARVGAVRPAPSR